MNRVVIPWCLRTQKIVTLLVTEGKYSEIMGVCYKIISICEVLLFMGFVVEYHIILHVDNMVTTLPFKNSLIYQWTKHTDKRHHLIWECIEEGT